MVGFAPEPLPGADAAGQPAALDRPQSLRPCHVSHELGKGLGCEQGGKVGNRPVGLSPTQAEPSLGGRQGGLDPLGIVRGALRISSSA